MSEVEGNGKHILITGATSGIGLDAATYLQDMGYNVIISGRDKEKLESVAARIHCSEYCVCDLSKSEEIPMIFDYCKEHSLKLDGMLHSAGCVTYTPIRSLNIDMFDNQMQIHYNAFIHLCKYFSSRKYSNDGASIVAISSLSAMTKNNGTTQYSASKAALNVAVNIAAKEFVKRKIRVNAILPANVDTRMSVGLDAWVDINEVQPFGLIPPRDISYLIEYLLSEKSKFITGALIPVTGGMGG